MSLIDKSAILRTTKTNEKALELGYNTVGKVNKSGSKFLVGALPTMSERTKKKN